MDALVFGEFFEHLTTALRKTMEDEDKDDTLSLNSLLKAKHNDDDDDGDRKKRPEDEEEFLKLHDGNYLKNDEGEKKTTPL